MCMCSLGGLWVSVFNILCLQWRVTYGETMNMEQVASTRFSALHKCSSCFLHTHTLHTQTVIMCIHTHNLSLIKTIKVSLVICIFFHDLQWHFSIFIASWCKKKNLIVSLLHDVSLATVSDIISWLIKRRLLEGIKKQRATWREVLNTGEVSVFLCVLFCIPECLYICVYSCGLKEKRRGWSVPGERYGLCPAAVGTKGLLLLCMLAVSVGDKVWSWEIRSGLANETHAKGLHGKLNLSTSISGVLCFEVFRSLHHITFFFYQAPLLSLHLYE